MNVHGCVQKREDLSPPSSVTNRVRGYENAYRTEARASLRQDVF